MVPASQFQKPDLEKSSLIPPFQSPASVEGWMFHHLSILTTTYHQSKLPVSHLGHCNRLLTGLHISTGLLLQPILLASLRMAFYKHKSNNAAQTLTNSHFPLLLGEGPDSLFPFSSLFNPGLYSVLLAKLLLSSEPLQMLVPLLGAPSCSSFPG